jgi:hypothetical protein
MDNNNNNNGNRSSSPNTKRIRLRDELQALPSPIRKETYNKLAEIADALLKSGDLGPALGIVPGTEIEVLWTVSSNDKADDEELGDDLDEEESDVWWKAKILGKTARMHTLNLDAEDDDDDEEQSSSLDMPTLMSSSSSSTSTTIATAAAAGTSTNVTGDTTNNQQPKPPKTPDLIHVPIYEILYDARPPDFPDTCRANICITDEHEILDVESNSTLPWRFMGSDWNPPPEHDDDNDSNNIHSPISSSNNNNSSTNNHLATLTSPQHPILRAVESYFLDLASQDNEEDDDFNNSNSSKSTQEVQPLNKEEADRNAALVVDQVLSHLATEFSSKLKNLPASAQQVVIQRLDFMKQEMMKSLSMLWQTKGKVSVSDARKVIDEIHEKEHE